MELVVLCWLVQNHRIYAVICANHGPASSNVRNYSLLLPHDHAHGSMLLRFRSSAIFLSLRASARSASDRNIAKGCRRRSFKTYFSIRSSLPGTGRRSGVATDTGAREPTIRVQKRRCSWSKSEAIARNNCSSNGSNWTLESSLPICGISMGTSDSLSLSDSDHECVSACDSEAKRL
jgi:hypothetical protein